MQNVIVLFGKPGAGKGTRLSEFLKTTDKKFNILSVGNMLRQARADNTELGLKAARYMDSGELLPDHIINGIVVDGMKTSTETVISDGFPRSVGQAQAMLDAGIIPIVIDFHVEDDLVIQRARDRIVCENRACGETYTINDFKPPIVEGICDKCGSHLVRRSDDDPEVVKNRLEVYREQTIPVLELMERYGAKVYTIDNSDSKKSMIEFTKLMNG